MRRRPALLLAILFYVTLDLSLATMPGAFVFDAVDSIESVQRIRGSGVADVGAAPAGAPDAVVGTPAPLELHPRTVAAPAPPPPRPPVVVWRPRLLADAPAPSEDPH